jgi:hypothetical protein
MLAANSKALVISDSNKCSATRSDLLNLVVAFQLVCTSVGRLFLFGRVSPFINQNLKPSVINFIIKVMALVIRFPDYFCE